MTVRHSNRLSYGPFPAPSLRAGNRARTGDLNLGKVALYQLSYARAPIFLRPLKLLSLHGQPPSAPPACGALSYARVLVLATSRSFSLPR